MTDHRIWRRLHEVPDTRARAMIAATIVAPLVRDLDWAYQRAASQAACDAIVAAAQGIIASAALVPAGWQADA